MRDAFSALQRAEIAEMYARYVYGMPQAPFSALQRAEIAEILRHHRRRALQRVLSVLFNEPKLLKFTSCRNHCSNRDRSFSALQRAEIAEILRHHRRRALQRVLSVLFNEPKLLKSHLTRK